MLYFNALRNLAERVGFKPTEQQSRSPDFESGPFDHSGIFPGTKVALFTISCMPFEKNICNFVGKYDHLCMKLSVVQFDIAWQDSLENIRRMDALILDNPGSDLYLLPEVCSTGFCMEPETCAEPTDGVTLQWMKRRAKESHCALAGSVATREEGKFYNRMYFVTPDGNVRYYNKHHLFEFSGEDKVFTAGNERVIWNYMGIRMLPVVCYDLRFPAWIRNQEDYDLMLVIANWPLSRRLAWDTLLRARAIENQCFVAGVNRVGTDPYGEYDGGSEIINAYGLSMAFCKARQPGVATVELNMDKLQAFREKFPALHNRDNFTINL